VAKKATNAHKYIKVSYIVNKVCLLHVSATLVALKRGGGSLQRIYYKSL
jgi:hypothetical protein